MTADETEFWKRLEAEPGDDTTKLVAADWYDEHDDPNLAYALRWCVDRNRWPQRRLFRTWTLANNDSGWVWRGGNTSARTKTRSDQLPPTVYHCVKLVGGADSRRWSKKTKTTSVAGAIEVLADALSYIRYTFSLLPKEPK